MIRFNHNEALINSDNLTLSLIWLVSLVILSANSQAFANKTSY